MQHKMAPARGSWPVPTWWWCECSSLRIRCAGATYHSAHRSRPYQRCHSQRFAVSCAAKTPRAVASTRLSSDASPRGITCPFYFQFPRIVISYTCKLLPCSAQLWPYATARASHCQMRTDLGCSSACDPKQRHEESSLPAIACPS